LNLARAKPLYHEAIYYWKLLACFIVTAIAISTVDSTIAIVVLAVGAGLAFAFRTTGVTTVSTGWIFAAVTIGAIDLAVAVVVDEVVADLSLSGSASVVGAALAVGAVNLIVAVIVGAIRAGFDGARVNVSIIVFAVDAGAAVGLSKIAVCIGVGTGGTAANVFTEVAGVVTWSDVTFAVSGERAATLGVNVAEATAIASATCVFNATQHTSSSLGNGDHER
jgi:hypothetical protein